MRRSRFKVQGKLDIPRALGYRFMVTQMNHGTRRMYGCAISRAFEGAISLFTAIIT